MTSVVVVLLPPTGEDEGQEQAGAASAGHHQGVHHASGREDQGGHAGVEPDQHQALGRLPQELHTGQSISHLTLTGFRHAGQSISQPSAPDLSLLTSHS